MIDKHAPQIVTADGESSSQTIPPCSAKASENGLDDRAAVERSDPETHLTNAPLDPDQTVPTTVSSAGHVSGLELQHPHSTRKQTTASDQPKVHHVSGTISPKIIDLQQSGASSRPRCSTDVSHTLGRASQLTVWESVTKTVPKCRTADQRCCASLDFMV
jgi:hypothetical protein